MSSQEKSDKSTIHSIEKIPLVLSLFSKKNYLTLHEIHVESGITKTTALRLCNSLINIGFLEKFTIGNTPYYRLGLELYKLGKHALDNISIVESARKYLNFISMELSDNSYLFIERNNKALCIDNIKGNYYIQTSTTNVGDILPFNKGAGPLAMLAFYSKPKQEEIIQNLSLSNDDEILLRERLSLIVTKGYAEYEMFPNTAAIGIPVYDVNGDVAGALSIGAIASRFSEDRISLIIKTLKKYSLELSRELGFE